MYLHIIPIQRLLMNEDEKGKFKQTSINIKK